MFLLLGLELYFFIEVTAIKLYSSGKNLSVLGCHNIEDVKEVSVGLGLQVVR